ncbi:MAG: serine O-acetyltransferase [Psychroserpens sp.]|jgi:serine O-acetyltransferase
MFRFRAGKKILKLHLMSHKLNKKGLLGKFIADRIKKKIICNFGCYISPKCSIAKTVVFPHPTGIVIGEGVVIGSNTTIYQNVTFGSARRGQSNVSLYPKVGENVTVFAGAVIIGNITIGDNAVIGANSVVNKDVQPCKTVAGIPAKEIFKKVVKL